MVVAVDTVWVDVEMLDDSFCRLSLSKPILSLRLEVFSLAPENIVYDGQ